MSPFVDGGPFLNTVATCLLTSIENPMCVGCSNYSPDVTILRKWLESLMDCHAVVIHDELPEHHQAIGRQWARVPVEFVQVESSDTNLFFARWVHLRVWLDNQPDVDKVFMTDGSDVVMNRPPWPMMEADHLYVGSENDTVANKWIVDNHPSIKPMAEEFPDRVLLNAGLLGGSRADVLELLDDLIEYPMDGGDLTDMSTFNRVLREPRWRDRFVTGPLVHTEFGKWAPSNGSPWSHK